MDTATLLEAYGALGATGMISLLFGFMITNLIKSQTGQQETLESLKVENKGQSETLENMEWS